MKLYLPNEKQLIHSPLYSPTSAEPYRLQLITTKEEGALVPLSVQPAVGETVYTDLLSYPFTLQLQQIVQSYETLKGVVRFRRTADCDFPIAEDVYALASIFGDAQNITVRTRELSGIHYVIILCKLGGVMAHFEYVTGAPRIEFEWSSEEHIVEFDSATMFGDAQNNRTLHYHLDAILQNKHVFDQQKRTQLATIEALVKGGERV